MNDNTQFEIRIAQPNDLYPIVALLANDNLGVSRESLSAALDPAYERAFEEIQSDSNNELIVICDEHRVVGTLQLTFIPNLTYKGGRRAQVEGVRVDPEYRGQGLGKKLLLWVIQRAREHDCHMLQLTMNKTRQDSHHFYTSMGFAASHEGFKLLL